MDDPERDIYLDNRLAAYDGYLPEGWPAKAFEAVARGSALDRLLLDLLMAWRTTAYTASMPTTVIKAVRSATLGYATFVSLDASLVAFADAVLAKVSRSLPELVDDRTLRGRLAEELVTVADEIRAARAAAAPEMPIEPMWTEFLAQPAFAMSVWSSQRVSYVAFYNAYEGFLVDCAKHALGTVASLRATSSEFKEALRSAFGKDICVPCWTHHELNIARLVRHALSHAGGRETSDLAKHKHGIRLVGGVLQVVPADNHKMLGALRAGVEALVSAAAADPKFA